MGVRMPEVAKKTLMNGWTQSVSVSALLVMLFNWINDDLDAAMKTLQALAQNQAKIVVMLDRSDCERAILKSKAAWVYKDSLMQRQTPQAYNMDPWPEEKCQ